MSLLNVKYDLEAELKSQKVGECLCVYGFYVYSSSYRYKSIIKFTIYNGSIFTNILLNYYQYKKEIAFWNGKGIKKSKGRNNVEEIEN